MASNSSILSSLLSFGWSSTLLVHVSNRSIKPVAVIVSMHSNERISLREWYMQLINQNFRRCWAITFRFPCTVLCFAAPSTNHGIEETASIVISSHSSQNHKGMFVLRGIEMYYTNVSSSCGLIWNWLGPTTICAFSDRFSWRLNLSWKSQGGLMLLQWYLKSLGGARYSRDFVQQGSPPLAMLHSSPCQSSMQVSAFQQSHPSRPFINLFWRNLHQSQICSPDSLATTRL